MKCQQCGDPGKTNLHEYMITKQLPYGDTVKQKRTFCEECAETVKGAGFKLTRGKQEAKPDASTEASEPPIRVDVPVETTEPESEPRAYRRRS